MFRSQLLYWKSIHDGIAEENAVIRVQCDSASKLVAEKEGKQNNVYIPSCTYNSKI